MVELTIHGNAFNVARRLTAQNDHDIMHSCFEETFADDKDLSPRRKYDYLVCREMASHVSNTKQLPIECAKYLDIVSMVQRRETDRSYGSDVLS